MNRKLLSFLIKLAVSGVIFAFVLKYTNVDQVAARLESIRLAPLAAAIGCLVLQAIAIGAWRWSAILGVVHRPVAIGSLVRMTIIGIFFNQILPTTFGGDGVRAWLLSRSEAPIDVAIRSVMLDRALGLFGLFLLTLVSSLIVVLWFDQSVDMIGVLLLSLAGLVVLAGVPLVLPLSNKVKWAKPKKFLLRFMEEVKFLLKNRTRTMLLILVSVFGHFVVCLAVWLTARAFAIEIPLGPTLVIVPPVFLVAALPISIAGWGVREGGMVFGLGLLGVASSDAALISVAIGLMGVAIGLFGALVWLISPSEKMPRPNHPAL